MQHGEPDIEGENSIVWVSILSSALPSVFASCLARSACEMAAKASHVACCLQERNEEFLMLCLCTVLPN